MTIILTYLGRGAGRGRGQAEEETEAEEVTTWVVHCLSCYQVSEVDISPFGWARCPKCGADRTHLRKMQRAQLKLGERP